MKFTIFSMLLLAMTVHACHAAEQIVVPVPRFQPNKIIARYLENNGHVQAAKVLGHIVVKRHRIGVEFKF